MLSRSCHDNNSRFWFGQKQRAQNRGVYSLLYYLVKESKVSKIVK